MKSALLILLLTMKIESRKIFIKSPILYFEPCLGSMLKSLYIYGSYPTKESNQYSVEINRVYVAGTNVTMEFDSEAIIELINGYESVAAILMSPLKNTFIINYLRDTKLGFIVKGVNGLVPYFNSMVINGIDHCHSPIVGYLDNIVQDSRLAKQIKSSIPDNDCGRTKVDFTALIVNGESTKPGDWPWHAAIYRHEGASNSYTCGGTLISKLFILTAAHCVTIYDVPVVPDILSVVLGKYHLIGGDVSRQERKVYSVIIHQEFGKPLHMDNDIALLKLMTEVIYTDYVQPACLWFNNAYKQIPIPIMGTVVGWGFDEQYKRGLASEIRQASLPILSNAKCIKRNLAFYGSRLSDDKKFCGGLANGTSPCNGDSGSGFMVYVPDSVNGVRRNTGAWYIRGITSQTLRYALTNICDPTQYVIFVDVAKYEDWIRIKTHEHTSLR